MKRRVADVNLADLGRGIARINRNDARLLGVSFGSLLELQTSRGNDEPKRAYVKCFFMRPRDEAFLADSIQINFATRLSLNVGMQDVIQISKGPSFDTASSVTVKLIKSNPKDTLFSEDRLLEQIEDNPLWKDALLIVPDEDQSLRFQVISVVQSSSNFTTPVCLGTSHTRIEFFYDKQSSRNEIGQLFAFDLQMNFKRKVLDYDSLVKVLEEKGFTRKEWRTGFSMMVGADLSKIGSLKLPPITHPPNIRWGRIQILATESGTIGTSVNVGHCYDYSPFEKPEKLLSDIETGLLVIKEALLSKFNLNLQTDVESIVLSLVYSVEVVKGKDPVAVLSAIDKIVDCTELSNLVGYRTEEGLKLHPLTKETSLEWGGLREITIKQGREIEYLVDFSYRLSDLMSAANLARLNGKECVRLVSAIEKI